MARVKVSDKNMTTSAFDEAYGRLNSAQRKAVDTVEGPVMVIAGPGTGKTQILALRIANILKQTDATPSSILALTFTESGVASMRARLVALMGQEGYHVRVHTFHGFCNEVIRLYPDRFPSIIGRTPQIELDAVRLVKRLVDELRPTLLRPHGRPDFYVRDILGALSETKREHITPEMLKERVDAERLRIEQSPDLYHEKGAHKGKMKGVYITALRELERAGEFAHLYTAYEEALATDGWYDFEDTIIAVIETLARDEEFKRILQEEHQYILADEHQDANGSQNELLILLSDFHAEPNLCIVGDEKQAIYRFQGASLENFFSFKRRYPNAVFIPLSDNYRSTQRILDAAHALIAPARGHEEAERVRLLAQAGHDEQDIRCVRAPEEDIEHAYIAERILALIADGALPEEIAILVRRNSDVTALSAVLQKQGIPVVAHGDDPVLAHPTVRGFIAFLTAVAHYGDDALLYPALTLPYSGLSNLDIYRLTEVPRYTAGSLYALLGNEKALAALGVQDPTACVAFAKLLDMSVRVMREHTLVSAVEQLFSSSGCLASVLGRADGLATLEVMRAFFRYIQNLADAHPAFTLTDVLTALAEAQEYRLTVGTASYQRYSAVRLMTVHRAKGMEFDHVFLPYMHDRLWGAKRTMKQLPLPLFAEAHTEPVYDDERRLLYVAMTRARKSLTFSYAALSAEGSMQVLSRFVDELKEGHLTEESVESSAVPFFAAIPESSAGQTLSEDEKAFLRKRLADQGLSVTALNNYLESPWKYFFNNLLRVPRPRTPSLLYGSAMDEALKWYTQRRKEGVVPDTESAIGVLVNALSRQSFTKKDIDTYRERGIAALSGYLAQYADAWVSDAESAVKLSVPFETGIPELPTLTLRGELDKVEHCGGDAIRIVDYKTGKAKTRGEIEGTTKTSNGNLKRQLVFYYLLTADDTVHQWHATEGILDFVEPDARGKYHHESFVIPHEEIVQLRETIRDAVQALYSFAFWETPCDAKMWDAEGCALVEALKSRKDF